MMIKKLFFLGIGIVFTTAAWSDMSVQLKTFSEERPQVEEITGPADPADPLALIDATLPACRYPQFEYTPGATSLSCVDVLRNPSIISVHPMPTSLVKKWCINDCPSPHCSTDALYAEIPGMRQAFGAGDISERTASLLVSWSISLQGAGNSIQVGGGLKIYNNKTGNPADAPVVVTGCNSAVSVPLWTPVQLFPAGSIFIRLAMEIDGVKRILGPAWEGQIPGIRIGETLQRTMTGSFILKAEDFEGQFPAAFDIFLEWANDTSITLTSAAGTCRLAVIAFPQMGE